MMTMIGVSGLFLRLSSVFWNQSITLDHSIRSLCAGRRAVFSVWQRELRTGRVGFSGPDLGPFKNGCSEGFFVAERISKSELRAAYAFADAKAARQGLTLKRLEAAL